MKTICIVFYLLAGLGQVLVAAKNYYQNCDTSNTIINILSALCFFGAGFIASKTK